LSSFVSRTISAALWNFLGNTGNQIIRFGIGIVLARILLPREYGLVGMLAIFLSLSDALIDSGFSQALIQKQHLQRKDYSTVFILNIIFAGITYLILFSLAPYISAFFEEPQLVILTRILGIGLIIRSFIIVQQTIYFKSIDFKYLSRIQILTVLFSGAVAIPMALSGFGVWSLVGLTISQDLCRAVLLWSKSTWRPSWSFSMSSLRSLFDFGSKIMIIGLLDNIFLHIYNLIIGKLYNAQELSFYTRAHGYRNIVSQNVFNIISAVSFPSFSLIQDQPLKLTKYYQKTSELTAYLITPVLFWMLFTAEPLIRFLITDKWIRSAPYLQIFCIGGLYYPLFGLQINILKALGKSSLCLRLQLINKALVIAAIIIGVQWGIIGLVYGHTIVMMIQFLIGVPSINRYVNYPMIKQLLDTHKYMIIGLFCFLGAYFVAESITENDLLTITVVLTIGGLCFFGITTLLKLSASRTFSGIVKSKFIHKIKHMSKRDGNVPDY
jgi:O-antigen/teichoic acid export membrane protein